MNRQTLVNTLLIIAGIVLAFALFAAGVFWHSRTRSNYKLYDGTFQLEVTGTQAATRLKI